MLHIHPLTSSHAAGSRWRSYRLTYSKIACTIAAFFVIPAPWLTVRSLRSISGVNRTVSFFFVTLPSPPACNISRRHLAVNMPDDIFLWYITAKEVSLCRHSYRNSHSVSKPRPLKSSATSRKATFGQSIKNSKCLSINTSPSTKENTALFLFQQMRTDFITPKP